MKKIAIVGGAPSGAQAPFDDPEWEIWVHGNQYDRHENRRVSRIFEIHDDLTEHDNPVAYATWLANTGIPLIVGNRFSSYFNFPTWPNIDVFPKEADVLGMLTSTPAYMMALAIHEKAIHIGIYGVEMAVDDHEYFKQRPAMYAWIAYAKGMGIGITIPEGSTLFNDKYKEGRDWGKKVSGPFTEAGFQKMVDIHQQKIEEYTRLIQTHDGCLQSYSRLAKIARAIESGQDVKNLTDSLIIKE